MPNEMIERVAFAIASNLGLMTSSELAKAAIEAMREPTEEMLDAGAYDLDMKLITQYQYMIDAALKE